MYLLAEVFFYAGQRSSLPQVGYRPDAVFDNAGNYWGITFVELQADRFDVPIPAIIKFTFEEYHYSEVSVGATFSIMEGGWCRKDYWNGHLKGRDSQHMI